MFENFIVIDCETTGLDVNLSRIVELSIYDMGNDKRYYYRVNPGCKIPKKCSDVHGIYDDDVVNLPTFDHYASDIFNILDGRIIVSYNGNNYDIPLLINELKRCGIEWVPFKQVDCLKVWQSKEKTKKLSDAVLRFCGKEHINAHSSEGDVSSTIDVFKSMCEIWCLDDLITDYVPMNNIMSNNGNNDVLYFGKYKGSKVIDVYDFDAQYIIWLYNSDFIKEGLKKHIEGIIKK